MTTALAPRRRLLIVDDETPLTNLLVEILEDDGFDAVAAGSLEEARALGGTWDLIIADVRLPNGDGRELRADHPDIPFLVISGAAIDDPPEIRSGLLPFLAKPFRPDELRAVVNHLLQPR